MATALVLGALVADGSSSSETDHNLGARYLARRLALVLLLLTISSIPLPLLAQGSFTVSGRVIDTGTNAAVQNARITLEGHGSTLSNRDGVFLFQDVRQGEYQLQLDAFGYVNAQMAVTVNGDTTLTLLLEAAPIELDPIVVESRTLDFDGRVQDPRTESYVSNADVRSDQGHSETANLFGRFDLDDVYAEVPLRVLISGFSYLPLDTTFVPDDEERRNFDLAPDPIVARMIERYAARLNDRASEWIYEYQPQLNREDLARLSSNTTLRQAMERQYPLHLLRKVGCFMLDEQEYRFGSDEERLSVFEGTFAGDLERIELLVFPGEGLLLMARVYTRAYFQRHVGTNQEFRTPSMIATPGGVFCR